VQHSMQVGAQPHVQSHKWSLGSAHTRTLLMLHGRYALNLASIAGSALIVTPCTNAHVVVHKCSTHTVCTTPIIITLCLCPAFEQVSSHPASHPAESEEGLDALQRCIKGSAISCHTTCTTQQHIATATYTHMLFDCSRSATSTQTHAHAIAETNKHPKPEAHSITLFGKPSCNPSHDIQRIPVHRWLFLRVSARLSHVWHLLGLDVHLR